MAPKARMLTLLAFVGTVGCNSAGFTGGSGKTANAKKSAPQNNSADADGPAAPDPPINGNAHGGNPYDPPTNTQANQETSPLGSSGTSTLNMPQNCTSAGVTQAQLLTSQLTDGDPSATLQYDLSLTDCQGNAQTISADSVLFDFDGRSDGVAALDFSITDGAQINYTGKLQVILDSDLFGNTGSNYQHYKSDNPFKLQTAAPKLHVTVSIGETGVISPLDPNASADTFPLATYLELGQAAPVQKNVTVVGGLAAGATAGGLNGGQSPASPASSNGFGSSSSNSNSSNSGGLGGLLGSLLGGGGNTGN
jgi:hypothetical protein